MRGAIVWRGNAMDIRRKDFRADEIRVKDIDAGPITGRSWRRARPGASAA
jgi:hypothetical protein